MFDFIRNHQRLMQFLLLVLVVPSFALIGVSGYSTYVANDDKLVEVGDASVNLDEFDRIRRNQLEDMQNRMGGAFDPAQLDTPEVRAELLDALIDRRVIATEAERNRFNVSDSILREYIAAIPDFQVDGRFSSERYNQVLNAMGYSSRDFEMGQRYEMALRRVL
ncbi:MAG TPA: SurA N-terminal domain-containing protein, partial [Burkholderiaceae bacterium]|nr:SurA N-terminal domain-containing protein [Burkholderiaceae bacterium]